MGTTCSNLHVFVRDDEVAHRDMVAALVTSVGFVSPPSNGWVSVFLQDEYSEGSHLGENLSATLGLPVVSIDVSDSDEAEANLFVGGLVIGSVLVCPHSSLRESEVEAIRRASGNDMSDEEIIECFGLPPESAIPVEPALQMFEKVDGYFAICGIPIFGSKYLADPAERSLSNWLPQTFWKFSQTE
jgi:hypothetical protein